MVELSNLSGHGRHIGRASDGAKLPRTSFSFSEKIAKPAHYLFHARQKAALFENAEKHLVRVA